MFRDSGVCGAFGQILKDKINGEDILVSYNSIIIFILN